MVEAWEADCITSDEDDDLFEDFLDDCDYYEMASCDYEED